MTNVQKVQAFFKAYAANDAAGIREILAQDIVWFTPGHHPLSGTKRGVEEVLAFLPLLTKGKFKVEQLAMTEGGDYVIEYHRGTSAEAGGMDIKWCLVFRFENGKVREVTNLCADQHQADIFFCNLYRLKPIPGRLA